METFYATIVMWAVPASPPIPTPPPQSSGPFVTFSQPNSMNGGAQVFAQCLEPNGPGVVVLQNGSNGNEVATVAYADAPEADTGVVLGLTPGGAEWVTISGHSGGDVVNPDAEFWLQQADPSMPNAVVLPPASSTAAGIVAMDKNADAPKLLVSTESGVITASNAGGWQVTSSSVPNAAKVLVCYPSGPAWSPDAETDQDYLFAYDSTTGLTSWVPRNEPSLGIRQIAFTLSRAAILTSNSVPIDLISFGRADGEEYPFIEIISCSAIYAYSEDVYDQVGTLADIQLYYYNNAGAPNPGAFPESGTPSPVNTHYVMPQTLLVTSTTPATVLNSPVSPPKLIGAANVVKVGVCIWNAVGDYTAHSGYTAGTIKGSVLYRKIANPFI